MSPILELRQATKEYRGVPAIKDVDFTLSRARSMLLGENGAGKSTLTKMIAGVPPTSGEMLLEGKAMMLSAPSEA